MPDTFTAAPRKGLGLFLQLLSSWWGRVGGAFGQGAGLQTPGPREAAGLGKLG